MKAGFTNFFLNLKAAKGRGGIHSILQDFLIHNVNSFVLGAEIFRFFCEPTLDTPNSTAGYSTAAYSIHTT